MRNGWIWLVNGLLLLLYVWCLGEETAVSIQVSNGRCLAIVPGRHIGIDCPGVGQSSQVGLTATQPATSETMLATYPPLRWLAPHTAWADLNLYTLQGQLIWQQPFNQMAWSQWQLIGGGWQTRWGELHGTASRNSLVLREPVSDGFILTSNLRRAENEAGLLLLRPDEHSGFVFIINGAMRRGVWWEWENGRATTPLVGIPFQKSGWQQAQSLLRLLLTGHQAALLLLGLIWVTKKAETHKILKNKISNLRLPISEKMTVVCLTLLTFGLTAHIASSVLHRVPHVQDSLTYLFQAQTLARGELTAVAPPLPPFFEQEFLLVQDGRWFGKYPPGYPLVLALGVLLNAPWLVNPYLAALTVPLLYQLGRRMFSGGVPLLAAGFMSLSPFFLFLSGSQMAHAAELFWLVLFMLCWYWIIGRPTPDPQRPRREDKVSRSMFKLFLALSAGAAAGLAFLTRQLTAVAIVAPFFLLTTWFSPIPWRRRRLSVVIWLAGLLPLVAMLFVYQGAVTGDPLQDPRLLYWPYDQLGFGDEVGEAPNLLTIELLANEPGYAVLWRTDPSQPPRGHTLPRGLHNVLQNWEALQTDLFGWLPLLSFSFLWLGFILKRPSVNDWTLLATLVGLVIAEIFYWHSGIMYGPRYLYGALPALLLLTARGVQAAAVWLGGRSGWWLTAVPLTLLFLGTIFGTLPMYMATYRGYNFVVGDKVPLVETAVPPEEKALVFVSSPTGNWWEYGELFLGNGGIANGRLVFARDLGADANRRLQAYYPTYAYFKWSDGQLMPLENNEP